MPIVSLAEAKEYLGQANQVDDNALITALIAYADGIIEGYTGRLFTLAERIDYCDGGGDALLLRYPPLGKVGEAESEVESIEDTLSDDEEYDLDEVDVLTNVGLIYIASGASWGSGRRRWKVTYGGGFNGAPDAVKQAALLIIAERYENRAGISGNLGDRSVTASSGGMLEAAKLILDGFKVNLI